MTRNLILLVLIMGTLTTLIPLSEGDDLTTAIAKKLLSLYQSGSVDFLGYHCNYQFKPRIIGWGLKYDGKFWCPRFASFSGRARTKSRSGAVEHAIQNFAERAVELNLMDQSDLDVWING
ncbi:UNVERIFIED_CONTAM: hypothetical protein RMT77_013554 [Armadillidium vulgare]